MKSLYLLAVIVIAALAEDSPALKELRAGNLLFTAKTYKELAKSNQENFLVCPLSVQVVLALVEAGAGGETARQLIAGLNLPDSDEKIQEAIKAIAPSLNKADLYELTSANKIYIKSGFGINPKFGEVATNVFNAEVQEIEFTSNDTPTKINNWVSEKTHDKIKDLVSKDDFDDFTRVVLVNALYFHGLWVNPFYVDSTKEKDFHVSSTKQVKVNMMEQTDRFNYHWDEDLKAKFLEMDYRGGSVSMTFVLPDDVEGLPALEANIDRILAASKFSNAKVHVQIPHVNVEHKIDFKPILKQFGVVDAFTVSANLSGIVANREALEISKVVQKTFMVVEEKGTTAAAGTAVEAVNRAEFLELHPQPPKEFEANHPFIFIMKSSDGVIFIGRFVGPSN